MAHSGLIHGPLGENVAHLCVDMQNMFAHGSAWAVPWFDRVLPQIVRIVSRRPQDTVFTRFMPLDSPQQGQGTWKRYYERWADMTAARLAPGQADLAPDLKRFVPPATVVDKTVYSPWLGPDLDRLLAEREIDTVAVTGGETDVCVLGTVLGAVDRGFRVILVRDALCSSSDETHDASLALYHRRYGQQVEPVTTDELLQAWR
ncbi:MAG TPA: isochorismatase family cysteine hydrolase [Mesorhizobium sp.]|jgi:nicotinamidase-related amidase|nr:isochorismatase family cysteine hydrolase [Mesorhizobium sp.]